METAPEGEGSERTEPLQRIRETITPILDDHITVEMLQSWVTRDTAGFDEKLRILAKKIIDALTYNQLQAIVDNSLCLQSIVSNTYGILRGLAKTQDAIHNTHGNQSALLSPDSFVLYFYTQFVPELVKRMVEKALAGQRGSQKPAEAPTTDQIIARRIREGAEREMRRSILPGEAITDTGPVIGIDMG